MSSEGIRLQGLNGSYPAKKAAELKENDVIIWNYGYQSRVLSVIPTASGKSVKVLLESSDKVVRERILRSNRCVAVKKMNMRVKDPITMHPIEKALVEQKSGRRSLAADVTMILEQFTTVDLLKYFVSRLKGETLLRYFLVQQIIANEARKETEENYGK